MMRPSLYQFPKSRRKSGGMRYTLIAILLLAGLGWIFWKEFKRFEGNPSPPTHPAEKQSVPAAKAPATPAARPPVLVAIPPRSLAPSVTAPKPGPPVVPARPVETTPVTAPPVANPNTYPRPPLDIFEAQVALARQELEPGSLDGLPGPQTQAALRAFQQKMRLPVTGTLDDATRAQLTLASPPCQNYTITSEDLARLQPLSSTWLGKSKQTALDYENILELVAEKGECSPGLVRRLNPAVDWSSVTAGLSVQIPEAGSAEAPGKAAFIIIRLGEKTLEAFDAQTNLLLHFPCSIAQRVEKRPVGELHVQVIVPNPNYTFDPDIFPDSAEARQIKARLVLPPGPRNPVGVAWIGLDKPGYGIHGTPRPEQVGRTESHGCFRLANWNAAYLLKVVWVGMPVFVKN